MEKFKTSNAELHFLAGLGMFLALTCIERYFWITAVCIPIIVFLLSVFQEFLQAIIFKVKADENDIFWQGIVGNLFGLIIYTFSYGLHFDHDKLNLGINNFQLWVGIVLYVGSCIIWFVRQRNKR